jgi:ATP-dependent DNA helicase RecG
MAIPTNIEKLLSGSIIEGTRIEFKEGWNPRTILRTVCAFANDFENEGSGYIVVGVKEQNGRPQRPVAGFNPDDFDLVQKEMIRFGNLIQPSYIPRMYLEEIDNKNVLVIWVPAGSNRPYKVPDDVLARHKNYNYRIRQLSSTVIPNQEQQAELIQLTARVPFDDRVNTQANIDQLSFALMREHLSKIKSKLYSESASMSVEELAKAMNLCEGADEHLFPKNVGLLMFSDKPEKLFPGVQIDVVEFPNGVESKEFSEKSFFGPVQKQLTDALSYIQTNIIKSKTTKYSDRAESTKVFNFPFQTVEEALANAVYHRNYELREPIEVRILPETMEIISYNGLDPSLKKDDFEKGVVRVRRYRNRRIGDFLKELELTEGRGTGIPTIFRALKNNGSSEPIFDIDEPNRSYFLIEIPIHQAFVLKSDQVTDQVTGKKKGFRFLINSSRLLQHLEQSSNVQINPDQLHKYQELADKLNEEQRKVLKYLDTPKKRKEILEDCLGLTRHTTNFKKYVTPLLDLQLIQFTVPDKPNSQFQKYFLSEKGKNVLHIINNFTE